MADIEMIALRSHTGSYGHVRKGARFTVGERESRGFARARAPLAEPYTGGEEEETPQSDLTGTPVAELEAALAGVGDADEVRRLAKADKRKTAAERYEARLNALQA